MVQQVLDQCAREARVDQELRLFRFFCQGRPPGRPRSGLARA
jgi:hypothetical protein